MIAHPPCTYLSNVSNRWYSLRVTPAEEVVARLREQEKAIVFFMQLALAPIPRVAVENPVGIMNSIYRKPDQIIHPYFFTTKDDTESFQKKATCLWLRGLDPLVYAKPDSEPKPMYYLSTTQKPIYFTEGISSGKGDRGKMRSKTFPAVAKAIAEQWGGIAE